MKRIELNGQHSIPHFIGCWNIQSSSICSGLIDFFEGHEELQNKGRIQGGLNEDSKKSIDVSVRPRDLEKAEYKAVKNYVEVLL